MALSLTLGAARDEEHNLETDRALAHYSRIQQWSGRSVYMSEMYQRFIGRLRPSLLLGASSYQPGAISSLEVRGQQFREFRHLYSFPAGEWENILMPERKTCCRSELPQPTQQLWDEVICLAVKRLHDKVKSRAQKSLAPVTTELRRAIARQD